MGLRIRILTVVWAAWWFGYMAPAHERGFVRVDAGCAGSCCEPTSCCDEPVDADDPCDESSDDPVRTCAMCRLLAKLDTPPAVSLAPAPLGLIVRIDPPAPTSVGSVDVPLGRLGRAPPFVV